MPTHSVSLQNICLVGSKISPCHPSHCLALWEIDQSMGGNGVEKGQALRWVKVFPLRIQKG